MIALLERTQSNVQQNTEQLQTPTMRVTINKMSALTHSDQVFLGLPLLKWYGKTRKNSGGFTLSLQAATLSSAGC